MRNALRLEFAAPSDLDLAYREAYLGLVSFANALAFLEDKRLDVELVEWLELKPGPPVQPIFGEFRKPEDNEWHVNLELLSLAAQAAELAKTHLELRLALQDYRLALANPDDALSYLYRALEEIAEYFQGWENMAKPLGLSKRKIERFKHWTQSDRHARTSKETPVLSGRQRFEAEEIARTAINGFIAYLEAHKT